MTEPTEPGSAEPAGQVGPDPRLPPLTGPLPEGPAYPGPPPPGYGPAYPGPPPPGYGPAGDEPIDRPPRSRLTAGLLGIFLGFIGAHRFYLGYPSMGVLQILVTIATCGIGGLWGTIEGVLILSGTALKTDADGRPLRA